MKRVEGEEKKVSRPRDKFPRMIRQFRANFRKLEISSSNTLGSKSLRNRIEGLAKKMFAVLAFD